MTRAEAIRADIRHRRSEIQAHTATIVRYGRHSNTLDSQMILDHQQAIAKLCDELAAIQRQEAASQ